MGYLTQYTLSWLDADVDPAAVCDAIYEVTGEEDWFEVRTSNSVRPGDRCKWYEHEDDVRTISALFPFALFRLDGNGEEAGDMWRKFFRAGKLVHTFKVDTTRPERPPA